MIINPIIPIWLMAVISVVIIIVLIIYDKKKNIIDTIPKIAVIILLFVINLRFMLPNGESIILDSDTSILFVIDTTVSMRALDYNGNKERIEGVIKDTSHIVDELSNCRFSIITFGDTARKVIPFTNDTDMVKTELESIRLESDMYAKGTSINSVKEILENTLKKEKQRQKESSKIVLFFISDGEITKEAETLETFKSIKTYISNGAVMGYGTINGGKMVNSVYEDEPYSEYYYLYYYDENSNMQTAISKLDENNLKQIAEDIGIEYIHMDKTSNINAKLKNVKEQISDDQGTEQKINTYQDTYYYFAIPLAIALIADFIIRKEEIGMKRKILIVIYTILILVALKIICNITVNVDLINKYNNGEYEEGQAKILTYLNFPEAYIANYNYGNILYQKSKYEDAIEEYEKALRENPPKDKECSIRINYALTICKTVVVDETNNESITEAIKTYETAIDILTENGCANKKDNNGHSQKAETLKKDIQKEIERLKQKQEQPNNSENEEEQQEQEEQEKEKDTNTIEEKIEKIREDSLKEQREVEEEYGDYYKQYTGTQGKNW